MLVHTSETGGEVIGLGVSFLVGDGDNGDGDGTGGRGDPTIVGAFCQYDIMRKE